MWKYLALFVVLALGCGVERSDVLTPQAHRLTILLQPLGDVQEEQLDSARVALSREHDAEVLVAPSRPLPAHAFIDVRTPRYRADTLIAWLRTLKPDTIDRIIGLTGQDISVTKYDAAGTIKEPASKYRDFGIYGLGYIGGPSCVVSTFRLGDGSRLFERLAKITVHEVGHTRGLPHCEEPTCVMRDAVERMSSIDGAGRGFCSTCGARLQVGFDPK